MTDCPCHIEHLNIKGHQQQLTITYGQLMSSF